MGSEWKFDNGWMKTLFVLSAVWACLMTLLFMVGFVIGFIGVLSVTP